jgi:sugar O-acyltransferase (sialic acid O-acetyltransferase NeuD family)
MTHVNAGIPRQLIIVGAGETADLAGQYFAHDTDFQVVAYAVEREYIKESSFAGRPIVPFEELPDRFPPGEYSVFVALSGNKLNKPRQKLFAKTKTLGYRCPSYVSSRAFVWKNVVIGENCFIFEDNTLQANVVIGDNVILWSGNHIGHHSHIGSHCFVSSHVVICGYCQIGEGCFLGVNAVIENNLTVGTDTFIGAGAIIRKSTGDREVYQTAATEVRKGVTSHRLFGIREDKG